MKKSTQDDPLQDPALLRIGAVAKVTGIPVSTLRIWELRHGAFAPSKTTGKHRLYSQEDVRKAGLLKQLSRQGHGIGTIAPLDAATLEGLRQSEGALPGQPPAAEAPAHGAVSLAVVGPALAERIGSEKFARQLPDCALRLTQRFADLAQAGAAACPEKPDILLVKVNTLHDSVGHEIGQLAAARGAAHTLVVYGFAQEAVLRGMRAAGIMVRREPVSDYELAELIRSALLAHKAAGLHGAPADSPVPARRYSDETLARVARISTSVRCECPRHVAELITQLASFEQYSQECVSENEADAQLHACLHAIGGSARALFERALEMVARHERISLAEGSEVGAGAASARPPGRSDAPPSAGTA